MTMAGQRARRGRPTIAVSNNILRDEVEDVAEAIKLRILANGGTWEVHAGPDGQVHMDRPDNPEFSSPPPDAWLVGVYTRQSKCEEIEEDIMLRLREIQPRRVA